MTVDNGEKVKKESKQMANWQKQTFSSHYNYVNKKYS